jgi:hypothetical protein
LKHPNCREGLSGTDYGKEGNLDTPLPKRSINVDLENYRAGSENPAAFVEITDGRRGRYAALSYCWGPVSAADPPLMLKILNNDQLQQGIPVSELPRTIQEAIELTRRLEIPYLWVDRLCIIQDDTNDWTDQAEKMCDIYEGACITISAFGAAGGDDGLFLTRIDTPSVRIACSTDGDIIGHMNIAHPWEISDNAFEGSSTFEVELRTNAWGSRAWVMQERLLSRRIVHFGRHQIYWECQETTKNEDGTDDGSDRIFSYFGCRSKNAFHHECRRHWVENLTFLPGLRNPMSIWEDIIRDYTGRKLSVASDKLRAIQGMAVAMKKRLGLGEYSYGIWLDGVYRLLLWFPLDDLDPEAGCLGMLPTAIRNYD